MFYHMTSLLTSRDQYIIGGLILPHSTKIVQFGIIVQLTPVTCGFGSWLLYYVYLYDYMNEIN